MAQAGRRTRVTHIVFIAIAMLAFLSAGAPDRAIAAEDGIALVRSGHALLQKKKYTQSIAKLTSALTAGGLKKPEMAKALYYRATAYRKVGQPAQAITDFSSALWLNGGLSAKERADAEKQRQAAYAEAGAAKSAPQRAQAQSRSPAAETASKPARRASTGQWQTSTNPRSGAASAPATADLPQHPDTAAKTPPNSGGSGAGSSTGGTMGLGTFFSNLFGGSATSSATTSSTRPSTTAAVPPSRNDKASAASSWSSTTRTSRSGSAASKPSASTSGRYAVQVAALQSKAAAEALAAKLERRHADTLKGRRATVTKQLYGDMGTLYQVRVAAFSSRKSAGPLCRKLEAEGLDCLLQTRR